MIPRKDFAESSGVVLTLLVTALTTRRLVKACVTASNKNREIEKHDSIERAAAGNHGLAKVSCPIHCKKF